MFDIGLFELLVVGGVGLVVIGPERLPGAIKTGALWIGRVKRSVLETRREIEQSIGADEIRRELRNEEIMASLEKLREARNQLEEDIKNHATSNTIEHNHDNDIDAHNTIGMDDDPHHNENHIQKEQNDTHNQHSEDLDKYYASSADLSDKNTASDNSTQPHPTNTPTPENTKEADSPAAKL